MIFQRAYNHILPVIFEEAHVKSVKYMGLVSFGHSLDLFIALDIRLIVLFDELLLLLLLDELPFIV